MVFRADHLPFDPFQGGSMQTRDIMIPLSECAQVSSEQSLQAAFIMLSAVRQRQRDADFRPRFVLVHDKTYRIIGVLRGVDMVRALARAAGKDAMSLPGLIAMAPKIPAKDVMIPYGDAACIDVRDSVETAIGKMLEGPLQHLLVKDDDTAVGIIRLAEIFARISRKSLTAVQD
jgi:CBS domain containing-hemolysin-like protein